MAKTEVYSWRIEPALKAALEEEARRRNESLSGLLEVIAEEWLKSASSVGSEAERDRQRHLQRAARRCFGAIAGGDPKRAEEAGQRVRRKLRRGHARQG